MTVGKGDRSGTGNKRLGAYLKTQPAKIHAYRPHRARENNGEFIVTRGVCRIDDEVARIRRIRRRIFVRPCYIDKCLGRGGCERNSRYNNWAVPTRTKLLRDFAYAAKAYGCGGPVRGVKRSAIREVFCAFDDSRCVLGCRENSARQEQPKGQDKRKGVS